MSGTNQDNGPWDSGLQIERTTLAWTRTALSFVVGAMVLIRLVARNHVALAFAATALTAPLVALITWLAWRRYRRDERSLHSEAPLSDGALPGAVAALTVVVGGLGLAYVLAS